MRYVTIKDLISDVQEGKLDPKTILIGVGWREGCLDIFNRDEVVWHGFASNALLELVHISLCGVDART